ncbi:hypothetical protein ACVWXL_007831 [Bradyrhizobium sp. GM22.5]
MKAPRAELGGARHQIGVGRRPDADHEHARAAAHRRDRFEQLLLVADRTVGQEYDLANHAGVAKLVGQRGPHRRHHLGAATRLQRADERGGFTDTLGIRRDGDRKQHVHGIVETDDVETVGRLETGERVGEARLGLNDRRAAHRAGIVDHEYHLARPRLLRRLLGGGRGDKGKQIIGVADALAK